MDPQLQEFTARHGNPVTLKDGTWLYPDGAQARNYVLEEPSLDPRLRLQAQKKYTAILLGRIATEEAKLIAALSGKGEPWHWPRDGDYLLAFLGPPPRGGGEVVSRLENLENDVRARLAEIEAHLGQPIT
jgi:hypothetical protein